MYFHLGKRAVMISLGDFIEFLHFGREGKYIVKHLSSSTGMQRQACYECIFEIPEALYLQLVGIQ